MLGSCSNTPRPGPNIQAHNGPSNLMASDLELALLLLHLNILMNRSAARLNSMSPA